MSMMKMLLIAAVLLLIPGSAAAYFYDDFNDGDISDWEPRCASGTWGVYGGCVVGSTATSPAALISPSPFLEQNTIITTSCMGSHAFGVIARLNESDTGVIAYVSPDSDVARIRLVSSGQLYTILASLTAPLPSNTPYTLVFTCNGPQLLFDIYIPSTGDHWVLGANTTHLQEGKSGLLMGDEPNAMWDWFEAVPFTGVEHETPGIVPLSLEVSPNPFSEAVGITLAGDGAEGATVRIYDMGGREVASLQPTAGSTVLWTGEGGDGEPLPPGVYLLRCECGGEVMTRRVVRTL